MIRTVKQRCFKTYNPVSCLNTFTLYVDSKMFGYYNDYMVFGVLLIRLGIAAVMSTLFGIISLTIVSAMRRTKII